MTENKSRKAKEGDLSKHNRQILFCEKEKAVERVPRGERKRERKREQGRERRGARRSEEERRGDARVEIRAGILVKIERKIAAGA